MLLLFMDANCGPCTALLPEVARWHREHADAFTVTIVSRGSPQENRRKFGASDLPHVLLQHACEVSERYSALGTPSAILVRPRGRVGTGVVAGADAIKSLVASVVAPEPEARLPLARGNGTHGAGALLVGAPAPTLRLPDLDGCIVDLASLRGQEALVLFWNPACGFCQRMLPDLKAWEEAAYPGAPKLLVVSADAVEANRAMGLKSAVVLDQDFSAGRAIGVGGTPSAVLIDTEGRIASPVAVGAQAVLALAAPVEAVSAGR